MDLRRKTQTSEFCRERLYSKLTGVFRGEISNIKLETYPSRLRLPGTRYLLRAESPIQVSPAQRAGLNGPITKKFKKSEEKRLRGWLGVTQPVGLGYLESLLQSFRH